MYRKTIIATTVILLIAIIIGCLVYWQWGFFGVVTEVEKQEMKLPTIEKHEPELYMRNRKVWQGETIAVKDLAKAYDEKGRDISYFIIYANEKGDFLQGKLDTTRAGVQNITVSVQSPVTGRKVSRHMIILVDGRVMK